MNATNLRKAEVSQLSRPHFPGADGRRAFGPEFLANCDRVCGRFRTGFIGVASRSSRSIGTSIARTLAMLLSTGPNPADPEILHLNQGFSEKSFLRDVDIDPTQVGQGFAVNLRSRGRIERPERQACLSLPKESLDVRNPNIRESRCRENGYAVVKGPDFST
jgi:hypothetical protein